MMSKICHLATSHFSHDSHMTWKRLNNCIGYYKDLMWIRFYRMTAMSDSIMLQRLIWDNLQFVMTGLWYISYENYIHFPYMKVRKKNNPLQLHLKPINHKNVSKTPSNYIFCFKQVCFKNPFSKNHIIFKYKL